MKLLLLAGTREARELSFLLGGIDLVSSLAGATQRPAELGGHVRIGGFGGVSGLAEYLRAGRFDAVVDATHPFAAQMSRHAFEACARVGLPLLQLVRSPWEIKETWTLVPDLDAAAALLQADAHVFLATGRGSLAHFKARSDVEFTTRVIDDVDEAFPLAKGRFLVSRPPFSVEEEVKTLQELGVAVLVARNSGGTGGIEKVIAADRLGLQVVMVARPVLPEVPRAATVQEALAMMEARGWLGA